MNDKERLAYLAGFIDGEGSIMYAKYRTYKNSRYYRIVLRIANNDPIIIKWIQDNFPSKWYIEHKKWRGRNQADSYIMNLHYNDAVNLIKKIKPFLICKNHQAKIAILAGYYHSLHGNNRLKLTQSIRDKLHEIMKGLNYRGRNSTTIRKNWGELLETLPSKIGGNQQRSWAKSVEVARNVQRLTLEELNQ